jgi:site-specific recombinase XerD
VAGTGHYRATGRLAQYDRLVDDWRIDGFIASLTALSENTRRAYATDLRTFADWCARSQIADPSRVKRTTVRRYLAYLTTRQFARRTMARKMAALRRYYR